ncbi:hypothetical protein CF65_02118 [Aggregatibacter actinomycetemcomitans HK1651]|nr:hypothetical protein CF65_02118 [Aggregatibacter actinomycetemcomitans HK1651]
MFVHSFLFFIRFITRFKKRQINKINSNLSMLFILKRGGQ